MTLIQIIWLIFTGIFIILAIIQFNLSRKKMSPFQLNPENTPRAGKIMGISTSQEDLTAFTNHFNDYIASYNQFSKKQNLYAAYGYLAAALTAILSFVLSVPCLSKFF